MWNLLKRWFGAQDSPQPAARNVVPLDYQWHEPGDDNPFGFRVLDVRPLTWTVISTTRDPRIAESFGAQRRSDGQEFIDAPIADSTVVACDLVLPHNGERLEGIVSKADCMEVKWDIYIYNSVFLFVRSWTGKLHYRARAQFEERSIRIRQVETSSELTDLAPQTVYFLLATQGMRQSLPHTIPADMTSDPDLIAQWSYQMFGKVASYATYDDITQITIQPPR